MNWASAEVTRNSAGCLNTLRKGHTADTDTQQHTLAGLVLADGKRRFKRPVDGPIVGTKMEEKQNFRVRFLHT